MPAVGVFGWLWSSTVMAPAADRIFRTEETSCQ
jgi:hypothetical protein